MSENVADEEEDDIYKNLPDFKYDDSLKKLENANKELQNRIRHLEKQYHETAEENLKLKEENHHLHENISSLLKTANNELKRKDRVIEELRKENNQLIFRRKKISNKTEIDSKEHTDDFSGNQKQELIHSSSNVQQHKEGLQLLSATSNSVSYVVKDVHSTLKASNTLPITQNSTPPPLSQSNNEVNDVSGLKANPSASAEFFPVDSIQDNYSPYKVRKNVVETVFSARMRKRLNAATEKNNVEIFLSTNTKQLCVSESHDEKINSSKEENHPNDGIALKNNQELKATETVKEATQNAEKSVNEGNILIELESDSSGSVELHFVDANQAHHRTTEVQSNKVETVFSERRRNSLNACTEKDDEEILVCTGSKHLCDSVIEETKINNKKENIETNDETARHNNQELKATKIVEEATQNEEKSVNAVNLLIELESDSSGYVELHSVDENQAHLYTTEVQSNTAETVVSEKRRNRLNACTDRDDKEILVSTGAKQSCHSRIDEAKINSSKEKRETNDETARNNNQELKATEIMKKATQNEEKSVNAGNILGELESNSSGSVELHTVDAKQDCHSATNVQENVVQTVFSEQMRNQSNASTEKDGKEIVVSKGTKQTCDSKIDETKVNSSKWEREVNTETGRLNSPQELEMTETERETTQNERKSFNAGNVMGELDSNSCGCVEFHTVDAKQDCHSISDVQKNVVETVHSEQMRKELNPPTEKDNKEVLVCTGTKQSCNSRIDEAKVNSSTEERCTDKTDRHNTHQGFETTEIEKKATLKERKSVNTGNITGELESNSPRPTELHSVDAKHDSYFATKGQKNVAETVFSTQMRKQLNISIETKHKEILVCTDAKQPSDSGRCNVEINSSKKEGDENSDTHEHNTNKKLEHIETLKEVPLNERTFVNADNVPGELRSNSFQSVEFQSVCAKQAHQFPTKVHNNGVETVLIAQLRKQLNASKETNDQETLAYTPTKQPGDSRNHENSINGTEEEGYINDATSEHKIVHKFESTTNVKEVSLNERKFADTVNVLGEQPFTNPDNDGGYNSRSEHVTTRTSLNEQYSYGVDSKKHHSHSPILQKRHRLSSHSSSTKSSSVESCVIQSEARQNAQKFPQRESTKHAKQDVKTNYHITGKHAELIRPVKASASVRVANSVKSKYSRSRSKTPFDGSRFKIPKLSSKQRVRIERSSVLEQNDSDSDSTRTRYSRQYSLYNSHRPYTSYRSRSRVRQSRDSEHYTEHRKYKHRDSSPVRECSSSHYKHGRRHSSAKFHDKDKRHIADRHSDVSKRPDSTRMETNGLLKKKTYCVDAEKIIYSQKKLRNTDFSLGDYRRDIVTGISATSCSSLGDEKHSKPSQKIPEHQDVLVENYNERKTQRTKSFSLKESPETENLNMCKGYEYKLKKITFENKEYKKPVSDLYHRLFSNSTSKLDKIQANPELLHTTTNESNSICSLGNALIATEEQRKENIVSSSDTQNVTGQAANDTEGKVEKFCNSAVFKTDGVSVSIFRETCDFSTSRKRKSVVIRSQRTSGSHDLNSPEEKRQRLNNDDKIIVETTKTPVTTIHDESVTERGQSVVGKTASDERGVTIPVRNSIGQSKAEGVQHISCTTDKQQLSVNELGKLNHKLDQENIKTVNDKANNTALLSDYVSEMKNQVGVSVDSVSVLANKEGLHSSTENCLDKHELRFKNVRVEPSEKRELMSERKDIKETRIKDMREELEEGEILDDSPVKISTAVTGFSESMHNMTLKHSCHRNVSKQALHHINPTSCSKRLLELSGTLGQNKSSQSNRHSSSSPILRDHLLHEGQQHDTHERQKISDYEMNNKYKVLDKFQSNDSEHSSVTRKQSSQHMEAKEVRNNVTMNERTQDVEAVISDAKFEKVSCNANNITSDSTNKDSSENGKRMNCQMNNTVTYSMVSESICLFSNDSQCAECDRQWYKPSDGNELECKGEVQVSSGPKSLKDDFSLCEEEVTVSEDINSSSCIETVIPPEKTYKQIDDSESDKMNKLVKSGDTVTKDVDVNNTQTPESDNSLVSAIGVHKEIRPKSCQKSSSECDKKPSEKCIEQGSKDISLKSAVTPLNSKIVSPLKRKKNARMTISTSQSSLQSEILMANLLQTHSPYKVGIHDESLPVSNKYTEELINGANCNDNGSLIYTTSKGSINLQSDDKHDSDSQRITRSKTTRLSSLSCQPYERNCSSEKSLTSPKKKMQKLMNYEIEQINLEEKLCKMTPKHCQSQLQDTDSVCSYIDVDDLNVNKDLEYERNCAHTSRELKSDNDQAAINDRKNEASLQETSEESINESRQSLEKDSMEITADGCAEIGGGGKEPLSGEELLKILEGSFENENGGSENVAKESESLHPENAAMSNSQQCEKSATINLHSATNKKNIIIRRRSRKCVLEEAPMKFITIKPVDDINPENLIDSSVAVSTDEASTNNNSDVCVTPSAPLCLQHDDNSCSSSSSSASSRSSSSSTISSGGSSSGGGSGGSSSSSTCSKSSSSMSLRSSVSGSSKSSTGGQQEESDKSDSTKMLRKSLRVTPARRLYQRKSQKVVHQPKNDVQDPQELEMSLNSSSSGNTSDDTFNPKKGLMEQLKGTWVKKKRSRNKR